MLMKMGRTACWLGHAVGRRQASLGTPVPRTPTFISVMKLLELPNLVLKINIDLW